MTLPHSEIAQALISPSPVIIEQRDVSSTVVNNRAREPIKQVRRKTAITIDAQISWGRSARVGFGGGGQAGVSIEASGYIVLRMRDLSERGVTLSRGDRVTHMGLDEDGEPLPAEGGGVYLTNKLYFGHISGSPAFVAWDFVDYEPAKVK